MKKTLYTLMISLLLTLAFIGNASALNLRVTIVNNTPFTITGVTGQEGGDDDWYQKAPMIQPYTSQDLDFEVRRCDLLLGASFNTPNRKNVSHRISYCRPPIIWQINQKDLGIIPVIPQTNVVPAYQLPAPTPTPAPVDLPHNITIRNDAPGTIIQVSSNLRGKDLLTRNMEISPYSSVTLTYYYSECYINFNVVYANGARSNVKNLNICVPNAIWKIHSDN